MGIAKDASANARKTDRALALRSSEPDETTSKRAEFSPPALARLRAVDDKFCLAYALNSAARLYAQSGNDGKARRCATEALAVASTMQRRSEIAIAKAILAWACEPIDQSSFL